MNGEATTHDLLILIDLDVNRKKNRDVYFCVAYSRYFSMSIHRAINKLRKTFNPSWLRVQISYHRFNNLSELRNGNLAA